MVALLAGGRSPEASIEVRLPRSLGAMDFELVDDRGEAVRPQDLIGRPALVFFGFAGCPDVCPTTLGNIGSWIEEFGKKTDLFPTGPTSPNQVSPVLPFGTDPAPYTYDGATMHGNGFFTTPLTSGAPIGLPRSSRVTFSAPGTYKYFCWIHGPDMGGTITVTS